MAFSIDRTRSYIKIDEPHLISLHRSRQTIVPADNLCQGHLCDAFICVVHEYNLCRVYLALHDQLLKSNLVFITDPIKSDNKKLAVLLAEAERFLENIGFEMEPVNIKFSPATREVIIRDTRVMRAPSLALQLEASNLAVEDLIRENKEIASKSDREQKALKAELEELRGKLFAATEVQNTLVTLPSKTENHADSDLQAELESVQKKLAALCEEGEGLRFSLAEAEKKLQRSQEELGNVRGMLKTAREGLKSAKDEAKQAKEELKTFKHQFDLQEKQLKSEQVELEKFRDQLDADRQEFLNDQEAYKSSQYDVMAAKDNAEAIHLAAITDLKAEIDRLMAELDASELAHSGETDVLRAALAVAEESLSVEKAKNESALQEMDALERNAAAELKLLKKKIDSLSAEKQLLEKMATEMKNKAHGEIERLQQVNQSQRRTAVKKVNALKEEIRQLAEARAVIASPTGMPLIETGENSPPSKADKRETNPIVNQEASFASDPFGSYDVAEYLSFLPDKNLKGIPYSFSTDVVEVYRSFNTIHAAPTGKQAQKCDGFVCLVNEGGHFSVFVAWLMNISGEVLVCRPEFIPEGADSLRKVIREGIGYFERIGFIIDKLHFEDDPDKRQIQLDELSIFYRTTLDCAA